MVAWLLLFALTRMPVSGEIQRQSAFRTRNPLNAFLQEQYPLGGDYFIRGKRGTAIFRCALARTRHGMDGVAVSEISAWGNRTGPWELFERLSSGEFAYAGTRHLADTSCLESCRVPPSLDADQCSWKKGWPDASSRQSSTNSMNIQETALKQMQERVVAGDAKGYAAVYAPDAVITIFGSGEIKGRDAIERYEADLMRQFPGAKFGFFSTWHKSPWAIAHYGVSGTTASGRSMGHEGLLLFRFNASGEIEDEHRYLDSLTPMAQLGAVSSITPRAIPKVPPTSVTRVSSGSADETSNLKTVTDMLSALGERDAAAFLSHAAEAIRVDEMILPESFVGRDQVQRWLQTWGAAVPNPSFEMTRILPIDDVVLVETTMKGRLQQPFGGVSASDVPFSIHRGFLFRISNGKVTELRSFVNRKELAEAVGQWPIR